MVCVDLHKRAAKFMQFSPKTYSKMKEIARILVMWIDVRAVLD